MTENIRKKLQTFINRCLRHILKLIWPQKISNEELWRRTDEENIEITIRRRRWRWLGHTLRKPQNHVIRQALDWNPQGKRKRGRPKETWRRTLTKEIEQSGKTWAMLKREAANRVRWRSLVFDLCSTGSEEDQVSKFSRLFRVTISVIITTYVSFFRRLFPKNGH